MRELQPTGGRGALTRENCRDEAGLGGKVALGGGGQAEDSILSSGSPGGGASVWSSHPGICDQAPMAGRAHWLPGSGSAGLWLLPIPLSCSGVLQGDAPEPAPPL